MFVLHLNGRKETEFSEQITIQASARQKLTNRSQGKKIGDVCTQASERASERTNQTKTNERKSERKRMNEQANERTSEGTHARTHARTHRRTDGRTDERLDCEKSLPLPPPPPLFSVFCKCHKLMSKQISISSGLTV